MIPDKTQQIISMVSKPKNKLRYINTIEIYYPLDNPIDLSQRSWISWWPVRAWLWSGALKKLRLRLRY